MEPKGQSQQLAQFNRYAHDKVSVGYILLHFIFLYIGTIQDINKNMVDPTRQHMQYKGTAKEKLSK